MSVLKAFHHTFHIQRHQTQVLPIVNAMCCSDWLFSACRQRSGGMCLLREFVLRLSDLLLTFFQPTTWRIMTFTDIIIQEMTASAQGFDKTLSTDGCLYASHKAGHYPAISLFFHCSPQLFNMSRRELSHRGSKRVERPFLPLNPLPITHRTPIIFSITKNTWPGL